MKSSLIFQIVIILSICSVTELRKKRKSNRGRRRGERDRSSRGLVPQLFANYSGPELPAAEDVPCSLATLACANRDGCGLALEQYMLTCSDLVTGLDTKCSKHCQLSLIALLSTAEGERLMQCRCEDDNCRLQKQRVEPCRSEVTWNTRVDSIVTCTTATWICSADPTCSTALDYYNRNCQKMFRGEKCSKRCKNSLDILLRQKSAAKLASCYCEGSEDFECLKIRRNTDVLCFGKKDPLDVDNSIDVDEKPAKTSGAQKSRNISWILISFLTTFAMSEIGSSVILSVQSFSSLF